MSNWVLVEPKTDTWVQVATAEEACQWPAQEIRLTCAIPFRALDELLAQPGW